MGKETKMQKEAQISLARRRLLKLGVYVPPAILGMATISNAASTANASKYKGSCKPSACKPCITLATSPQLSAKKLKKLQGQCLTAQKKFP